MDSSETVVAAVAATGTDSILESSAKKVDPIAVKSVDTINGNVAETNHVNGVSEQIPIESVAVTNHIESNGFPHDKSNGAENDDIVEQPQSVQDNVHATEDVPPVPHARTFGVDAIQAVAADITIAEPPSIAVGINPGIEVIPIPNDEPATSYPAPVEDAPATSYPAPVDDAPASTYPTPVVDDERATVYPVPIDNTPSDPNAMPEFVTKALNDIAAKNGFVSFRFGIEQGSQKGDGFVADIFKVTITDTAVPAGSDIEPRTLILIVKLPPKSEFRRDIMGLKLFKREVYVYNEVLPAFTEFQRERGLRPGKNGFFSYPRCHFASYDEAKAESVLIMDDIRYQDYYMENRFKPTKYDNAKSVMQHLGQFHAISLAMKDQTPEKFERFKELTDVISDFYENDLMASMIDINFQKANATLEPSEQKIKDKLNAFSNKLVAESKRCNNGDLAEPHSVLLHGDCHINNVMFKIESGIPKHVCLFDWQIARYASPAIDILYFIFLCTDKPLRDQHFDHLIQAYHNALFEQLELLGSDPNQLFPFTALLRQLKQFGRFVLGTAVFAIPMLCMDRQDLPDMDEWAEKFKDAKKVEMADIQLQLSQKSEDAYKLRMSGVLRDMYRKGYF